MAFIRVGVADSTGTLHPLDSREVFFSVEGDAEIVAVCNGNAMDFSSFEDVSSHRLFNGAAVLYVRRGRGKSVLTASAPGLAPCSFGL
jgi:hypothetical protein